MTILETNLTVTISLCRRVDGRTYLSQSGLFCPPHWGLHEALAVALSLPRWYRHSGLRPVEFEGSSAGFGLSGPDPAVQGKTVEAFGNLPLSFEANQGQTGAEVKFLSRGSGYTLFLTGDEAKLFDAGQPLHRLLVISLQREPVEPTTNVLRTKLGKKPIPQLRSLVRMNLRQEQRSAGSDAAKQWRSNVPTAA